LTVSSRSSVGSGVPAADDYDVGAERVMRISIIIPVFSELATIAEVLARVLAARRRLRWRVSRR